MRRPRPRTSTEERLERAERLRQWELPQVLFSERQCLICSGGALPITTAELPAILGRVKGVVTYPELVEKARRAGFTADHCYTSAAGVSICKSEKPR